MVTLRRWSLLSFLMLLACSTTSYTHGIPNLVQVRTDVWKMLKRGFHPELIGLLLEWHALNAEK